MKLSRLFRTAHSDSISSEASENRLRLEELRLCLEQVLSDCDEIRRQRVIYKIRQAQTPAELWLLRSDLHQCVSQSHDQAEAARRINALLDHFSGWLPASQLTRI